MIELNHIDYAIIYKNKIDPFRIFGKKNYTIELQGYIIYLINSDKEVPQELFSEVTREDRYEEGGFPQIESICEDILMVLVKKGIDIEDEKYNDVLLGVQGNDSMSENFTYRVMMNNLPFPLSFAYLYDNEPKDSYYLFKSMIEYGYLQDIPDFIIKALCMKSYYIMLIIRDILDHKEDRRSFFKYIDIFLMVLYKDFNYIIDRTKDLANILYDPDSYETEHRIFSEYVQDLTRLIRLFMYHNVLDKVDVFLDFLNTKKFQDHINIYLNFKHEEKTWESKELKSLLRTVINFPVKESFSFKAFFNR